MSNIKSMTVSRTNCMGEMSWEEYHHRIQEDRVLILPVGATEQHARHLPLSVDSLLAEKFSIALAERTDAVVAPTLCYGYKSQPTSGGGPLFPGTTDLNGSTVISLVRDLLEEFLVDGWQKILILNAHFENQAFLIEAADLVLRHQKSVFPKILLTSWYDNISPELIPKVFENGFDGWELEHAAILETSAMMYFAPELVKEHLISNDGLDKLPTYHSFPADRSLLPASGALHTSVSSSAEKGRMMVENALENVEAILRKEFETKAAGLEEMRTKAL